MQPFTKVHINFNSHAHVERDLQILEWRMIVQDFNSHAHVERDTRFTALALYYTNFNSHAHVERDPILPCGQDKP